MKRNKNNGDGVEMLEKSIEISFYAVGSREAVAEVGLFVS